MIINNVFTVKMGPDVAVHQSQAELHSMKVEN